MTRSCGMPFPRWNSLLVTGGYDNNDASDKTFIYNPRYSYTYYDLKVPRYFHACGTYKDPADNLDVIIFKKYFSKNIF